MTTLLITSSCLLDLHEMKIDKQEILVSCDVLSLHNVPVDKTMEILAERALKDNWFK